MSLAPLTPRFQVEKEFEKFSIYTLMKKCDEESIATDLEKSEILCRALATVTGLGSSSQGVDGAQILVDCLDCGVCEVVVEITNRFAHESEIISSYALMTICNMAFGSIELREYLGEIGACESIIFAMEMNIGHPETSEYGSCAVGILAFNHIGNSFRLAQAGACDTLAQAGNFGFNIRHPRCQVVATNVCTSLCYLCEASIAKQLRDSGVAALLHALLRFHLEVVAVIQPGIKALCGLASLNSDLRALLGSIGCCELVMDIMGKYTGNVDILMDCCEAILHLTLYPSNSKILYKIGAVKSVAESLGQQLSAVSLGSEVCTGALVNLCTVPGAVQDLFDLGGVETLKTTQFSSKVSYRARENIQKLLELMNKTPSSSMTSVSSLSSLSSALGSSNGGSSKSDNTSKSDGSNVLLSNYTEFRRLSQSDDESDS